MKQSNVKYAPRFQPKFKFKIPTAPNNRRNPVKSITTSGGARKNATSPELPIVKPPNDTAPRKSKSSAETQKDVTSWVNAKVKKARRHRSQPLTEALPSIAESGEDRTIEDILQMADIRSEQGESVDTGIVPWSIFGNSQPQDGQLRKNQDLPSKVFEFPCSPGRGKQKSKGKKEREQKIKSNLLRTIFKTCNEIKKIKERRQKLLGKKVAHFVQSASIPVTVSTAARININSKYQVAPSSSVEEESFGMRGVTLEKKLQTAVSQAFMTEE